MCKGIILFLLSFLVFQFADLAVYTGFSHKSECCAQEDKVDSHEWDFGQIKQGEILNHDFILKNETNNILTINNIHTSCGCTASESAKKSLMPQESTTIIVSFNSKGYLGAVTQFVYVNTDNADLAIIKFTIKAQVVKE